MKKTSIFLGLLLVLTACGPNEETSDVQTIDSALITQEVTETETLPEKKKPKSPRMQSVNQVGGVDVMIDYGSPFVKGRTIWGELVPFNKVWRAGANETTKLVLADKISIEGKSVNAGTYGVLIIPKTEGDWTIILNEAWDYDLHGIWGSNGYDETKDVMRFEVTPTFKEDIQESLTFTVESNELTFAWGYARFSMSLAH
ncbi:MAG: DUF2911 domain-containing protein [Crocinitomicaceae bacterium]